VLPSSQTSLAVLFTTPSPQTGVVQSGSQFAANDPPLSHCSPGSTRPLPHTSVLWQVRLHPSPLIRFPSSQVSPIARSIIVLPHDSSLLQSAAHRSPPTLLPSSHTSPTAKSITRLPQDSSLLQSAEHPSPDAVLPSSQTSPDSTMPFPHAGPSGASAWSSDFSALPPHPANRLKQSATTI
jgi:hypothetical protein